MGSIKVGSRVEVVARGAHGFEVGATGTVDSINDYPRLYKVVADKGVTIRASYNKGYQYVQESQIRLIEPVTKESKKASMVRTVIESLTSTQFFGVLFEKKGGDLRIMNCRRGVTAGVTGRATEAQKSMDKTYGYMTVYDTNKKGFRKINLDKVIHVRFGGQTINFS
jgi:hypothetical protein